jgi:hypothetical protein
MSTILLFGVLFLVVFLLKELALRQPRGGYTYRRNPKFRSPAEVDFYRALTSAVSAQYVVFAKVRLLDVIVPAGQYRYQTHLNKVMSKHVDFVLCDRVRHVVTAVVELDDSSHSTSKAIARDEF